jgi:NTP pyrophosphatase (non-canonical NTP hydrolase)
MPELQIAASLDKLQNYVRLCEAERGFAGQSGLEKCLLLGEEVGELFRAVRRTTGLPTDPESARSEVSEELADILNYLLSIANRFDVNLESAFREKEHRNARRAWK